MIEANIIEKIDAEINDIGMFIIEPYGEERPGYIRIRGSAKGYMRRLNSEQDIKETMLSSVAAIIAYFLFFGLTHSLLADHRVKRAVRLALGPMADKWYRLSYVALAAVTVLPFFYILASMPDETLYVVTATWKWLMIVGQALAALALRSL